jgi:hypothetical protein
MSPHDADAGASLPDPAESKAATSTTSPDAHNNPEMSLPNTASPDETFESHAPVITHYKKSPERKIAAQSQKSNRVLQTPAKVSMDRASDTPTSTPSKSRKKPEILDDEQGEPSVKQEQSDEESTSPQDVKKSGPVKGGKRRTIIRHIDSDEEDIATEAKSAIKNKNAAKHGPDPEGNGAEPKKKKRKTKVSALDTLGISDETMAQSKAGKSRKTSGSKSVNAEVEYDGDLDEDAGTQGSSGRAQGVRRLNHGDAARKTIQRVYSTKREPGHWPELCSLSQTKAKNIHKKLRDSGQTLLAEVAEAICFPDEVTDVKPHNSYVSTTYLKSVAPGEYNEKGFVRGSTLKKLLPWQVEETLGVPYVFFRATDETLALIGPDEDLQEVLKGKSPRMREGAKRKDDQTSAVSAQPLKKFKTDHDQGDFSIAPEFGQSTPAMASASERMTQEANKLELLHVEYDNINTSMQQSAGSMQQSVSDMQTIAEYAKENTGRNLTDIEEYINFMDKNEAHISLRKSDPEAGRVWQALTRGFKSLNHFSRAMASSLAQTTLSDEQEVAKSGDDEDEASQVAAESVQGLVEDHKQS